MSQPLLIEGYASLFGVADKAGDVVRAGAFAASLRKSPRLPMLLQHRKGAVVGQWSRIVEDSCGLWVRGLVTSESAQRLVARGLNGLSIGFRPEQWVMQTGGGRRLLKIALVEISLVADPMLPAARFSVAGPSAQVA